MIYPYGSAYRFHAKKIKQYLTCHLIMKIRPIPIILVHEPYWRGLIDWFHGTLCEEGAISPDDMNLMHICNEPQEVVEAIFAHYEARGFEPSAEEKEILLEL